ncbi:unnamed protein product, partial [Symbiodinium sp. KB8]
MSTLEQQNWALARTEYAPVEYACINGARVPATQPTCVYQPCSLGKNCSTLVTEALLVESVAVAPSRIKLKLGTLTSGGGSTSSGSSAGSTVAADKVSVATSVTAGNPVSFEAELEEGQSVAVSSVVAFQWASFDSDDLAEAIATVKACVNGLLCGPLLRRLLEDSVTFTEFEDTVIAEFGIPKLRERLLEDASLVSVQSSDTSTAFAVDTGRFAEFPGEWAVWLRLGLDVSDSSSGSTSSRLLQARDTTDLRLSLNVLQPSKQDPDDTGEQPEAGGLSSTSAALLIIAGVVLVTIIVFVVIAV